MENNTFNISEIYVGKVVSVYLDTHELEVYIPKLMPTLNYGFSNTTYSVDLQSEVVKTNTLLCKPTDFKERVPDKGSLVHVRFLDDDIKKIYWFDFDPFGTNTYIEFEKAGNEKILEDFANTFNVNSASLIPKDVGVVLGSKAKPFAEIYGNINSEYVIGLDQKLQGILETVDAEKVDLNTKYTLTAVDSTADVILRLTPDDLISVSSDVTLRPGVGISITPTENIIVIENTSPNVDIPTNLSATHNVSDVVIVSSDGDDATINAANTNTAGVMTKAMFDEHVLNNAKVSNVTTDLGATHNVDTVVITSSDGSDATINAAGETTAGVLTANAQTIGGAKAFSGTATFNNEVIIKNDTITDIPISVNAMTGTTADLQDWKVNGVEKASIDNTGLISAKDIFITDNNLSLGDLANDLQINGVAEIEKSKWALSYVASTRIFTVTLSGASYYYVNGNRMDYYYTEADFALNGLNATKIPLAAGVHNWTLHTNTSGTYFFYFDSNGVATTGASVWDILTTVQVAYVMYNSANDGGLADGILLYELHGMNMTSAVHKLEHITVGTKLVSGGALTGIVLDSETVANISWTTDTSTIVDEDIYLTVPIQPQSNYNLGYFDAPSQFSPGNQFNWRVSPALPIFTNGTNIQYNPVGQGLVAVTTNNRWINYYVVLLNANTPAQRTFVIPGQTLHTSLVNAQAESPANLNMGSIPFQEFVFLYKIIFKYLAGGSTTTGRASIDVTPTRFGMTSVTLTSTASDHNLLSNRNPITADAHLASSIAYASAPDNANTALTSSHVQGAIEELEDIVATKLTSINGIATELIVNNSAAGDVPLSVNAIAGTTADLQDWKVDGSVLASVDHHGNISGTTLFSTVAQGTAPLSIISTTMVTNLNSEMLGGKTLSTIELDIASKVPKTLSILNSVSYATSLSTEEKDNSYMYVHRYISPSVSEPRKITISEVIRPSIYTVTTDTSIESHIKVGDFVFAEISGS